VNEEIDRMRHSATRAILERDDVIIVASVPASMASARSETYSGTAVGIQRGDKIDRQAAIQNLVALQYKRNDDNFVRGAFRVRGDTIDIFPAHYEDRAWRVELFGDVVDTSPNSIPSPATRRALGRDQGLCQFALCDAAPDPAAGDEGHQSRADPHPGDFRAKGKLLEAQRLEQRCTFDLEMIEATGSCAGSRIIPAG
jgi:excinuclease ABC subunit B